MRQLKFKKFKNEFCLFRFFQYGVDVPNVWCGTFVSYQKQKKLSQYVHVASRSFLYYSTTVIKINQKGCKTSDCLLIDQTVNSGADFVDSWNTDINAGCVSQCLWDQFKRMVLIFKALNHFISNYFKKPLLLVTYTFSTQKCLRCCHG